MPFTHYNLPTSPELTHKSQQKLIELDYNQTEQETTTLYEIVENTPGCPMCGKPLVKQSKIIKTYYDEPINNKPHIIQIKRRLWLCCKKFQPTPLDPRVFAVVPKSKLTPKALSYIEQKAYDLSKLDKTGLFITRTLTKEIGIKANPLNKFLKPMLANFRKQYTDIAKQKQGSPEENEFLVLKTKRENSEIPLTREERARYKELRAKLDSKYSF